MGVVRDRLLRVHWNAHALSLLMGDGSRDNLIGRIRHVVVTAICRFDDNCATCHTRCFLLFIQIIAGEANVIVLSHCSSISTFCLNFDNLNLF